MTHVAAPGGNGISDVKDEDSAAGLPRRRTQNDLVARVYDSGSERPEHNR